MGARFSSNAEKEIEKIWTRVEEVLDETKRMPEEESFLRFDKILVLEKEVNKLQKRLKENHIDRLNKKICKIEAGVVFISLVDNLEKIANHLANIAEGIKGKLMWKIETGPNET